MGTDWVGFLSVCMSLSSGGWLVGWLAGFLVRLTVKGRILCLQRQVEWYLDLIGLAFCLSVCRRVHSVCARVDVT